MKIENNSRTVLIRFCCEEIRLIFEVFVVMPVVWPVDTNGDLWTVLLSRQKLSRPLKFPVREIRGELVRIVLFLILERRP